MNSSLLGEKRPELGNLTICNEFEPIILEGQRCHSLNIATMKKKTATKEGKTNGLFLLLDPNPYSLTVSDETNIEDRTNKGERFKVYIHTLAQYRADGPGTYAMSALKNMKGTKDFNQLPDKQKKCMVHNREECETKRFLQQVWSSCKCVPWALVDQNVFQKVPNNISWLRDVHFSSR